MAAIALPDIEARSQILKRNWASENPGPILVFCIVFVVGLGILSLFAYRKWMARKARRQTYEVQEVH
jgi:hypothetical protein